MSLHDRKSGVTFETNCGKYELDRSGVGEINGNLCGRMAWIFKIFGFSGVKI